MSGVTPGSVVLGYLDPGRWSACFGLSLRDLCLYDAFGPQQVVRERGQQFRHLSGTGQIAATRDKITKAFLDQSDGEWLWFIDTDMGFDSDTVERLVKSADPVDRPVMGGLCFTALNPKPPRDEHGRATHRFGYAERYLIQPTVYAWTGDDSDMGVLPVLDYPRDTVVECSATGAACLLIHRSALEKVRAKCGDEWFQHITHPTADKGQPRHFSEDISFCVRLAACDIPVHVDTSVKTTHEKGFVFLDEETFDDQMALIQLKRAIADEERKSAYAA